MTKKIFSCFFCIFIVFIGTLFANQSKNLSSVDFNQYPLDARNLALSNSALALSFSPASTSINPAFLKQTKKGFSTPYINFVTSNISQFTNDTNSSQNNIFPLYQIEMGASARLKKFALDFKLSNNIYQENEKNSNNSSVVNFSTLSLSSLYAHSFHLSLDYKLSLGFQLGTVIEMRSNQLSKEKYFSLFENKNFFDWFYNGAKYVTQVKIPVKLGLLLSMPYGFSFASTIYSSQAISTNPALFSNASSFLASFGDMDFVFDSLCSLNFFSTWSADVASSWRCEFGNKYNALTLNVAFVKIRDLFPYIETWPDHLKLGAEYEYNNITVYAGWQTTGPSFGVGLDFYAIHVDASYGQIITYGNSNKINQLSVSLKLGIDE